MYKTHANINSKSTYIYIYSEIKMQITVWLDFFFEVKMNLFEYITVWSATSIMNNRIKLIFKCYLSTAMVGSACKHLANIHTILYKYI